MQACVDFDVASQVRQEIEEFAQYISLITVESPELFDRRFHGKLDSINSLSLACPQERPTLMRFFFELTAEEFDKGEVQKRSRCKPLGYAGDYLTIDWMYTQSVASSHAGKLWDDFFHRQAAPTAVRNRKQYFCSLFTSLCRELQRGVSVLNLASGPCRDVADAISQAGPSAVGSYFHCVDIDKDAVTYAQTMVQPHTSNVSFEWQVANVFKFKTDRVYDLVWSAGLFDYLDDDAAASIMQRMWEHTRPSGKLVVGNFHPSNASRNYMEWAGAWFLIHRTEEQMLSMCERAGIPNECVAIEKEPLGACIFAVATRPA